MRDAAEHARRKDRVDEAFRTLPERYLGVPEGVRSTVQIRLGDIGRVYEVVCTTHGARVRVGTSSRPDVTISSDAETWLALRAGELSGISAFSDRRLVARGDLDAALAFEGMFRLPSGRPPIMRLRDIHLRVGGRHLAVNVLTMGTGVDVLLIHGLGATKTSFFDTAATLSRSGYRVHAIDLPGFGSSSKPLNAPYNAAWFAKVVQALMDALDIDRAHIVGNSMGGRVALEVGLTAPRRIRSLVLLAPAVAFVSRPWLGLVKIARPELGMLPHAFTRGMVAGQLRSMFADPDAMDPAVSDIAVDEFRRIYGSPAARRAFLTAARNIYLDTPFGRGGFYERLSGLRPPALFVWGTHDPLIPSRFARHVGAALPQSEQIVIDACGHVPQIERPEQTSGMTLRFFQRSDATLGERPARAA